NLDEDYDFEVLVYLYDIDKEKEIDHQKEKTDINSGRKDDLEFTFRVPENAYDNPHAIYVRVIDDKNNYCNQGYVKIDVERLENDIQIKELNLEPLDSCNHSFIINTLLKNEGTKKYKDIKLTIENRELGISQETENLELNKYDKGNSELSEGINIEIPKDAKQMTYKFKAVITYDNDDSRTTNYIDVIVNNECKQEQNTQNQPNIITLNSNPNQNINQNNQIILNQDTNQKNTGLFALIKAFFYNLTASGKN
ncbi:MAG: hypothetical protein KKF65_06220, partial [Nanoarchaeota archaeon]|nr:hypothetical protein [Nanoarchaeota archaeon]